MKRLSFCLVFAALSAIPVAAQGLSASQRGSQPIYSVSMVSRTTVAINYRHRSGPTRVDFRGTPLLPLAKGEARVESKKGDTQIDTEFHGLEPAQKFGPEYLTYVLWAITPEGKPNNLGELILDGTISKLDVTTPLPTFGMIITAEPYFAVTMPSDVVVLENALRSDTKGQADEIDAKYELLQRGQYTYSPARVNSEAMHLNSKVPLALFEARNSVYIAQQAGADRYAADTYGKAQSSLSQAEDYLARKQNKKVIETAARDAVQTAADARAIALKRRADEEAARQQEAAAQREARAREEAEEAAAKQQLEEQSRQQAEQDAARQAQAREEAERAQQAAAQREQQAQEAAAQAEREKQELRASLLAQFNRILETIDTPRGLVVHMADVNFDTAKYNLRPEAREKLAKFSGIIMAHPGLKLSIEGYTDSTGSDSFNQKLSEDRADSVRDYLIQQGISPGSITAQGLGKSSPVASNDTPTGRQQNRRVEIIISGEVIGTKIGSSAPSVQ